MAESVVSRALQKLPPMIANKSLDDAELTEIVSRLVFSISKSVQDPERSDFAKGREQMAMYAIALLLDSDWKTIERILFGDDDGSG